MTRRTRNATARLDRRAVLRGLGACLALPPLEALARPVGPAAGGALATTASGAPLRLAFVGFPNGVNLDCWRPTGTGPAFELGKTFAPVAALKSKLQVFTGFAQRNADPLTDGPGDHARANAALLTGCHPRKTAGADIRNGISMDQVIAQKLRGVTRLPSLELISMRTRRAGTCDSGYSCVYEYNVSWASETMPLPAEANPRQVFERLFGAGPPRTRQRLYLARQQQRRSLLDFIRDEARALDTQLGRRDQQKLAEYLGSVREVERQIESAERLPLPRTGMPAPSGIPEDFRTHIRLMCDLMALAFQTDSTRVATFLFANESNNRSFREIGITEGHHLVSHHQSRPENLAKVARIDRFYMEQLGYLLEKLNAARDADGRTLLDNSMILYGCGNSDGNRHNHDNLPILLAGGGGGRLHPGRHVKLEGSVPLNNLFLGLLEHMGAPTPKLGDSTNTFRDV